MSKSDQPDKTELLTTRQAAEACGLAPHVLRYYTTLGVVDDAGRTDTGRRLYPKSVIEQVKTVKRLLRLGYTLRDIRETFQKRIAKPHKSSAPD
jgi:DNA-binding transcriptional MerR regulator